MTHFLGRPQMNPTPQQMTKTIGQMAMFPSLDNWSVKGMEPPAWQSRPDIPLPPWHWCYALASSRGTHQSQPTHFVPSPRPLANFPFTTFFLLYSCFQYSIVSIWGQVRFCTLLFWPHVLAKTCTPKGWLVFLLSYHQSAVASVGARQPPQLALTITEQPLV